MEITSQWTHRRKGDTNRTYRGAPPDSLSVVVGSVGPPISFSLHISQNHILNRGGQTWHFPWNVGLPTPPGLTEVLQNSPCLVLFDSLRHHICKLRENIQYISSKRVLTVGLCVIFSIYYHFLEHFTYVLNTLLIYWDLIIRWNFV